MSRQSELTRFPVVAGRIPIELSFATAVDTDASAIASLRAAVANEQTRQFGHGHWSSIATEAGVLRDLETARVLVARSGGSLAGTVRLATRKPWAIEPEYFTPRARVVYLTDMAVAPALQRQGIGLSCMAHAREVAAAWPVDAIRLDAYDGPIGAGRFYARCGFREVARVTYRKTPLVYYELLL